MSNPNDDHIFINSLIMGYCFNPGTVRHKILKWFSFLNSLVVSIRFVTSALLIVSAYMEHFVRPAQSHLPRLNLMAAAGASTVFASVFLHASFGTM